MAGGGEGCERGRLLGEHRVMVPLHMVTGCGFHRACVCQRSGKCLLEVRAFTVNELCLGRKSDL